MLKVTICTSRDRSFGRHKESPLKSSPIPFNKPPILGEELRYFEQSLRSGKIAGDGIFSKKCQEFFKSKYGFDHSLLTTSCTDALELSALLLDLKPGDEIILPSFTFVSTANPFLLRGAKLRFCDSTPESPNISAKTIEPLINEKTKAVVVVHYGGVAVDMDPILDLCSQHSLALIEDAAQAIDSFYNGRPLGSVGDIGTFSFHETKNISCGEGGMITLNKAELHARAEILREKGTNRSAFFRGEVDKYNWVDVGSSFLPSDLLAAFLYCQLQHIEQIQSHRKMIWDIYNVRLKSVEARGLLKLQSIPAYATNNAHMFYVVCQSLEVRTRLIGALKAEGISPAFHYQSLHASPYFSKLHDGRDLPWSDHYSNCLLRLPLYFGMTESQAHFVCDEIEKFFRNSR